MLLLFAVLVIVLYCLLLKSTSFHGFCNKVNVNTEIKNIPTLGYKQNEKKKEYVDEENQHQKINDEKQIRKKEEPKIIYFIKKYKIYI